MVRHGRGVPDGFLPIYSVDTDEEAERLLVLACPTNAAGEFVAPELVEEQTLDNLRLFGRRLARAEALIRERDARRRPSRTREERARRSVAKLIRWAETAHPGEMSAASGADERRQLASNLWIAHVARGGR